MTLRHARCATMTSPVTSPFLDAPPHAPEAERTVLGALLLDPEAVVKVSDFLRPEDFYDPKHRMVYQAIYDLYQQHEAIDFVTLANRLRDMGKLEDVGGSAYLAEIVAAVPTASHVY